MLCASAVEVNKYEFIITNSSWKGIATPTSRWFRASPARPPESGHVCSWEFFITRWPATCHLDDGPLVRVVHHAAAVFQHYGSQVDGSSSSRAAPGQRNLTHASESSSSRPTGQGQQYQSLDMAMPSWPFVGVLHHAPTDNGGHLDGGPLVGVAHHLVSCCSEAARWTSGHSAGVLHHAGRGRRRGWCH